jgi:hemerythrin-like domain-containing protein
MTLTTQPLRDEHKELLPRIESLKDTADSMTEEGSQGFRARVHDAYDFLAHHLLPHARAEEEALYPVVAKAMNAPQGTATMTRDHVEVAKLVRELGDSLLRLEAPSLNHRDVLNLRRILYGLYTLVKVHFAKEEEVYLPLLDATLSAAEAEAMFNAMHRAAVQAKSH